jgi:hypothetical protein
MLCQRVIMLISFPTFYIPGNGTYLPATALFHGENFFIIKLTASDFNCVFGVDANHKTGPSTIERRS